MHSAFVLALLAVPTALAVTYDVSVGKDQTKLVYDPEYVNAHAGDVIQFVFHPKNHTVTESSFETPCSKLAGGEASGFQPVNAELFASGKLPTFRYHVVDSAPRHFYCGQRTHCGKGMVFAVNPAQHDHARNFDAFKANALAFGVQEAAAASSAPPAASASVAPAHSMMPEATPVTVTQTVTWKEQVYTTTYESYPGSANPTPLPQPVEHEVFVGELGEGQNGFTFNPSVLKAAVGDRVKYTFAAKNHTVTRSSFGNPCSPLTNAAAFDSGFRPAPAGQPLPTFTVAINDTAPIYIHCMQGNHCDKEGMVMIINEIPTNNLEAFKANARAAAAAPLAAAPAASGPGGAAPTGNPSNDSGAIALTVGGALASFAVVAAAVLML